MSDSRSLSVKTGHEAVNILVRDHVGPWLRSKGFKRSGFRFLRWRGRNCQLIKFLTDTSDESGVTQFTLYLGVFSKALWHFESEHRPAPAAPDQPDCQWGGFLEEFVPRFRDRWFAIPNAAHVLALSREILTVLETEVIPHLSKVETDEDLRDYWLTGRSPGAGKIQRLTYLAFLCHELGPKEQARRFVDELRAEASGTPAAERALKKLATLSEM